MVKQWVWNRNFSLAARDETLDYPSFHPVKHREVLKSLSEWTHCEMVGCTLTQPISPLLTAWTAFVLLWGHYCFSCSQRLLGRHAFSLTGQLLLSLFHGVSTHIKTSLYISVTFLFHSGWMIIIWRYCDVVLIWYLSVIKCNEKF